MTIPDVDLPSEVTTGITVLVILLLTIVAAWLLGRLVRRAMTGKGPLPSTSIFVNITRIVVVAIGVILILGALGIPIAPLVTALGVGGLAVALALQDTLGNLFAGLQLVASKQVRPGDYLLLDTGQEGTVADTAWRTTTLRTQSDNLVIVPNSVLAQAIVTNYRLPAEVVATTVEFGVGYDVDLGHVERVVSEVASQVMQEAEHEIPDRAPLVRFRAFEDSQILCAAVLYVPGFADQFPLRSAFIKALHARFADEGISFPYPQRVVHMAEE